MRVGGVGRVEGLCDPICFGFIPRREREKEEKGRKEEKRMKPAFSFFVSWVSKTQSNHWTKRIANTRLLRTQEPVPDRRTGVLPSLW